jgi:hypothetical protein
MPSEEIVMTADKAKYTWNSFPIITSAYEICYVRDRKIYERDRWLVL